MLASCTQSLAAQALAQALGVPIYAAVGLCEMLRLFTAEEAEQGDVGRHSNAAIAAALGWDGCPDRLVAALEASLLLRRCPTHRYILRGWSSTAPDAVQQRVARSNRCFADGSPSRRRRARALSTTPALSDTCKIDNARQTPEIEVTFDRQKRAYSQLPGQQSACNSGQSGVSEGQGRLLSDGTASVRKELKGSSLPLPSPHTPLSTPSLLLNAYTHGEYTHVLSRDKRRRGGSELQFSLFEGEVEERGGAGEREGGEDKNAALACLDALWAEFRAAYPRRSGSLGGKRGRDAYEKLLAAGESADAILDGARRYAAWCDAVGKAGTEYVAMISTWLHQRRWEEEYVPPPSPERGKAEIIEAWRRKIDRWTNPVYPDEFEPFEIP